MRRIIAKPSHNIDKITDIITKLAAKSDKDTFSNTELDFHKKVFAAKQEYQNIASKQI